MVGHISSKPSSPSNVGTGADLTGKNTSGKNIASSSTSQTSSAQSTVSASSVNNTANAAVTNASASEKVAALVKQLNDQGTIQARVSSSQPLDKAAQQLLVKLNPTAAAQLSSATANQGSSAKGSADTPLYLVKLSAASTTTNAGATTTALNTPSSTLLQPLVTTISSTALKIGDSVALVLNKQGNIVVKPEVASVRPIIAENIKQALPQQQSLHSLLTIGKAIGNLPQAVQNALLPPNTQQALQQLNTHAYQPSQLQSANQIKAALQHSGVLAESTLQQGQGISQDIRNILGQLLQALPQEGSKSDGAFSKTAFDQIINLWVQQTANIPVSAKPSVDNVTQQLATLMQLLGIKISPATQGEAKKARDVIAKGIEQMIKGVQEKIHLNQLRSLGVGTSLADDISSQYSSKTPPFTTDITLRWGEYALPLAISIREEEHHSTAQKQSNEQEEKKITRRWQVFMSFDLPAQPLSEKGSSPSAMPDTHKIPVHSLHSQLTIVEDTVSATLWSESASLCQQAKQQLNTLRDTLRANGLQVDELLCINGKPPSQEMSLDYHLIDVKT